MSMFNFKDLSMAKKFFITLLPLSILAVFIVIIISVSGSEDALGDMAKEELTRICEGFQKRAVGFVERNVEALAITSTHPSVEEAFAGSNEKAAGLLKKVQASLPYSEYLAIMDSEGNVIGDTEDTATGTKNYSHRDFFKTLRNGAPVYVSEPEKSERTGKIAIFFSYPVKEGGKFRGIILGASEWDFFMKNYVDNVKIGKTGYGFIIGSNGINYAHPKRGLVLKDNVTRFDWGKTMVEAKKNSFLEYNFNDSDKWLYFLKDPIKKWNFAVVVNKDEILDGLNSVKITGYMLLGLSALLFVGIVTIVTHKILTPLDEFKTNFKELGDGNLDVNVQYESKDELGTLGKDMNIFVNSISSLIGNVKSNTESVSSASLQISSSTEELAATVEEQSAQSQSVSTALQQLAVTSGEITDSMDKAGSLTENASEMTRKGSDVIKESMDGLTSIKEHAQNLSTTIGNLGNSTDKIGNIIDVINDVADQTNLLALNAAIEAARAGEAGRGFAVVADEVRKLAERTGAATKEIENIIVGLQKESSQATDAMDVTLNEVYKSIKLGNESLNLLDQIVVAGDDMREAFMTVASAIEEENATIDEITNNIKGIAQGAEESASSVQEVASTADDLAKEAENLKSLVEVFKTKNN